MATIDERVVSISFENTKFEANVTKTMGTLTKLDTALKNVGNVTGFSKIEAAAQKVNLTTPMSALDKLKQKLGGAGSGATAGFGEIDRAGSKVTMEGPLTAIDKVQSRLGTVSRGAPEAFGEIERASSRVNFEGLTSAIDNVQSKFGVLEGAAAVTLGNIGSQVASKGAGFAKSFALGPISQGFEEYQTNLNSIQTILANTKAAGTDLGDVNKALDELNTYSDQTIYNFGQMANSIGLFTAAGVDLDTSVSSIKGLSNLAALSGSDNEKATHAQQQLSQAIAAGKVTMQDWISVRNAGMGGTVFQRALAETAQAMGTLEKGSVKLTGKMKTASINGESFGESIRAKPGEKSWLTSKVLTTTLAGFTGDLTDAQLAAQGFNGEQIEAIQTTAKAAKLAATEVKTLPQAFDVAKETIGSGWSATFRQIFGDFNESKKTFTGFSNAMNAMINSSADARNKIIGDWKKLGGRKELIEGVKDAFEAIGSVIGPIKDAFRDIFPAKTGQDLFRLTRQFRDLMQSLKLDPAQAEGLRRTFAGVFAVFHIGISIITQVIKMIGRLLGSMGGGGNSLLNFSGSVGDILVAFDNLLTKGGALDAFFKSFEAILRVPLNLIKEIAKALGSMFSGADTGKATGVQNAMDGVVQSLKPMKGVLDDAAEGWKIIGEKFQGAADFITPIVDKTLAFIKDFGKKISAEFGKINWDDALDAFSTGLVAGLFVKLRNTLTGGIKVDIGGGVLKDLNSTLKITNANLAAMQHTLQAATLLEIAAAIALLAAGIYTLSTIDGKKLNRSMGAVSIGLGELIAAVALLSLASKSLSGIGLLAVAGSLILVAGAVTTLAIAFKLMSTLSWEDLAKGLVGTSVGLIAIGAATQFINPALTLAAAAAVIPLAIGMVLLAHAMTMFAALSWEDLLQGLFGVAESLAAVALGLSVMPVGTLAAVGPGLVLTAIGLTLIAGAIATFGAMDLLKLYQGLIGVGGALAVIGITIGLIPPTLAAQAAGLIVLGIALTGISAAVALFGNMDLLTLSKGILAITAVLITLGIGLIFMESTVMGSLALLAAATAFAILGPALVLMGHINILTLVKSLGTMAAVLGVLALVGAVAAVPLTALSIALAALAGAMVLGAFAFFIFAAGLAKLGLQGPKALLALSGSISAFLLILPKFVGSLVNTLLMAIEGVAKLLPKVILALGLVLDGVIAWIIRSVPNLAIAVGTLIDGILQVLLQNTPKLLAAGAKLLLDLLTGLTQNMPAIIVKGTDVVVKFLGGLAANAPRLVAAGAKTLTAFLQGIQDHIPEVVNKVSAIIQTFLVAVGLQAYRIVGVAGTLMVGLINAIGNYVGRMVSAGANAIVHFINGIGDAGPRIISAGVRAASKFLHALADGLVGLADVGFDALIDFLNGLAAAIRENDDKLIDAGANLMDAIVDGFVKAASRLAGPLKGVVEHLFGMLPGWARKILGANSPSTVFMGIGKDTMLGMAKGLSDNGKHAVRQISSTTSDILDAARSNMGKVPSVLDGIVDTDPVITPVLDLSNVHKEAQNMPNLASNVIPITAAASYDQASAISQSQQTAETAQPETAQAGATLHFEQNNYSPEALTPIEVYRQTNNQLANAKSALGLATTP